MKGGALMNKTKYLTRTAMLLALTLVIQMLGFPTYITGPLVNMMLFIATILLGSLSGTIIGALTPWIALSRGILPPPLAAMVPFIIGGNIILVITYNFIAEKNQYLGILTAAILKFALLSSAVRFFIEVKPPIAAAMQLPQLLTAIAGGFLALLMTKYIVKVDLEEDRTRL